MIGKKKYNSIDLCKIFMAVCVVAMHTKPLDGCSNRIILSVYDSIVNCAVPFFFLASGYLLSVKLSYPYDSVENIKIIGEYLQKIAERKSSIISYATSSTTWMAPEQTSSTMLYPPSLY